MKSKMSMTRSKHLQEKADLVFEQTKVGTYKVYKDRRGCCSTMYLSQDDMLQYMNSELKTVIIDNEKENLISNFRLKDV